MKINIQKFTKIYIDLGASKFYKLLKVLKLNLIRFLYLNFKINPPDL